MGDIGAYKKADRSLAAAYERVGRHAPGFDTIRLVAALMVVMHHVSIYDRDFDHLRDDPTFILSHGYTTIGFFAVCLFFCISGFLVTPGLVKTGDVTGYFSRRFMRIMPLLTVVVTGTVFVLGPLVTRLPLNDYFAAPDTWRYLKNITTSLSLRLPGAVNQAGTEQVNGALWTLRYEWLCYIVLGGLAFLHGLRRRGLVLAIWLGSLAATAVFYSDQTDPGGQPLMLAHLFAYFGAGVLLYLYREAVPATPLMGAAAAVLLLASWATGTASLFAPGLTAYIVAILGLVRFPWSKVLAKGDISYGVYLLHAPMIVLVLAFWTPPGPGLLLTAVLALTLPLAALSWFMLEKPALAHKTLPADLARRVVGRISQSQAA